MISIKNIEKYVPFSRSTLLRWLLHGEVEYVKIGSKYYPVMDDINKALNKRGYGPISIEEPSPAAREISIILGIAVSTVYQWIRFRIFNLGDSWDDIADKIHASPSIKPQRSNELLLRIQNRQAIWEEYIRGKV